MVNSVPSRRASASPAGREPRCALRSAMRSHSGRLHRRVRCRWLRPKPIPQCRFASLPPERPSGVYGVSPEAAHLGPGTASGQAGQSSHRHRCDTPQRLLGRPARRLDRQAIHDSGDVAPASHNPPPGRSPSRTAGAYLSRKPRPPPAASGPARGGPARLLAACDLAGDDDATSRPAPCRAAPHEPREDGPGRPPRHAGNDAGRCRCGTCSGPPCGTGGRGRRSLILARRSGALAQRLSHRVSGTSRLQGECRTRRCGNISKYEINHRGRSPRTAGDASCKGIDHAGAPCY